MTNVYLTNVFIPDPITTPPPAPEVPPSSELPTNLRLNPSGGSIRGGEVIEIYSYERLRDPNRDDSFAGRFTRDWTISGKTAFEGSGLILSSTNGIPTIITHPTNDFRYFVISVDFSLNINSFANQDFFSLRFVNGSNEFLIKVSRREDLNIIQAEMNASGVRRFGSFQVLNSRFGTLSIVKSEGQILALFNKEVIFTSDSFPDITGEVQISALSQSLEETSVVSLSNFRDEPGAMFGDKFLLDQNLLDDYSISAITPSVSFKERGLRDVKLFGRFGIFTKSNIWNYYLPTSRSIKSGGSFSANFYGDKGLT